jgi:hypothetical protein
MLARELPSKGDPLKCRECDGTLLPLRAIKLDTGMIEYLCIDCRCIWLLVLTSKGFVFTSAAQGEKAA